MGRPLSIPDPDTFDMLVDVYVSDCKEKSKPVTWHGMLLALGFKSAQTMKDYGERAEFKLSVSRAKLIVAAAYEAQLLNNKAARGAETALANLSDWKPAHIQGRGNVGDVHIHFDGKTAKVL